MSKRVLIIAVLGAALAACGDSPQGTQAPGAKKADAKAWEGTGNGHVAQGWKSGDQASWEAQLRARAQAQNEYTRAPAQR
jgi:hypothetical protein